MRHANRIGIILTIIVLALAGCSAPSGGRVIGGQPVAISELPTYPGADELSVGESTIIDPLFGEAQQEPPPFIGLGIEVERSQRTFRVPSATTFADIKSFYADKLQSAGWREDPVMRVFTTRLSETSPTLQGGIWVRVDQTLLIVLASDPAGATKEVTLSLATH